MSEATSTVTVTVNADTKSLHFSDRLSAYESRPLEFALQGGSTWPAGTYRFALTYAGRAMALANLTDNAGSLTGTLLMATTEMEDAFARTGARRLTFNAVLWDESARMAWGISRVDVIWTDYQTATVAPTIETEAYYKGSASVTSGSDVCVVDISTLGLAAAPSQVFGTVTTPAGGANIFATCTAKTATALTFTLSAEAPAAGYRIDWLVFT